MKKGRNRKGETLVETVVSFAIVLLTLVTITATVQLCIRLNNRAMEKAEALEADCTALETAAETGGAAESALIMTLPDQTIVELPIDVYEGELLGWFAARETEGG